MLVFHILDLTSWSVRKLSTLCDKILWKLHVWQFHEGGSHEVFLCIFPKWTKKSSPCEFTVLTLQSCLNSSWDRSRIWSKSNLRKGFEEKDIDGTIKHLKYFNIQELSEKSELYCSLHFRTDWSLFVGNTFYCFWTSFWFYSRRMHQTPCWPYYFKELLVYSQEIILMNTLFTLKICKCTHLVCRFTLISFWPRLLQVECLSTGN